MQATSASGGFPRAAGIVLAVVVAGLGIGGYAWVNSQQSQLDQKLDSQVATLNQTIKDQGDTIKALQDKLHMSDQELANLKSTASEVQSKVTQTATQLADTQKKAADLAQQQQQAMSEINSVKQDTGAQLGQINNQLGGVKTDVSSAKTDIKATQADLDATKAKLTSTIGDLGRQSGLIATTQSELDELKKLNMRTYYDFTLEKTKTPQRVGPFLVQLKSVDAKKNKYTVDITADDKLVEKKDKNLNEPVQFLTGDASSKSQALNEMVVFKLDKNSISGYIEAPKYAPTAAAANPAGSGQ